MLPFWEDVAGLLVCTFKLQEEVHDRQNVNTCFALVESIRGNPQLFDNLRPEEVDQSFVPLCSRFHRLNPIEVLRVQLSEKMLAN